MEQENKKPIWMESGKLNEVAFAEDFLRRHEMVCCDGAFFSKEGRVSDEHLLRRAIYKDVRPYVTSAISRKVESILSTMRLACSYKALPMDENLIHVKNGTYDLANGFSEEKRFCRHRLPVNFNWNAPEPVTWLKFLDELLSPMDIETLQEFMGYCLIPTTRAQKMLLITGRGGEGKSRIGVVMKAIFGCNLSLGSIAKLEASPFARADLEHLLVMVDDDLKLEALNSTNYIKSIITAELPMDLERKGEQSYQGLLTTRFMAFGNGTLRSLHDRSHGFFRRQIILTTLPRPADRVDDPYLSDKLKQELEGILLWSFYGLCRLMQNDFHFTISPEAEANMAKAVQEGNNILEFLSSTGYITYDYSSSATSRDLYECYKLWCEDNAMQPLKDRSFWSWLRENAQDYQLGYTNHIPIGMGRCARGFRGIKIL